MENKVDVYFNTIDYKGNNKQIIFDNIDLYTKNAQNLYNLMNFVEKDPVALSKVKEYMDNNPEQALDSIFCETKDLVKMKDDTLKGIIKLIIKDVMENEKVNYSDIEYSGGGFSRILFIGDKVVKLGDRYTKNFPNNPYIISPLLRRNFEKNGESCFVEVTERVDTSKKASLEELYQLYKKLRDLGLIWTDIKDINVGRLRKENIIHWNKNLAPSEEVLGFDYKRGNKVLQEGDLVILDADFIFDEKDPNINYSNNRETTENFEKRYQSEKRKNIVEKENQNIELEEINDLDVNISMGHM